MRIDKQEIRRHLTGMKTTLSSRGQIVLPAELRRADDLKPGQPFEIERVEPGEYRLKLLPSQDNRGFVDWLLTCPEKGYFVPVASESTEDLRIAATSLLYQYTLVTRNERDFAAACVETINPFTA
jgi:AbrB family looped-hinge helix DNA binding protein